MIDTDAAVTLNYQRLVSDAVEDVFEREDAATTLGTWRERVIGELRDAMQRLFPSLVLNSLGSPLRDPTFRFAKGTIQGFVYKNLSGGEKAAFDLLLDLAVKRREYNDSVYCVDEPEAHMNPRVHAGLLREVLELIPANCQLWIATHAIGMMREARDLEAKAPGTIAFFDFGGGHDFDEPVTLWPVQPTRVFWENALRVALDDLADLVAPREVVVCEGNPIGSVPGKNAEHDARCYAEIFGDQMPDVKFVSGGNSHDVARDRIGFAAALPTIVKGTSVRRLIDRDEHSPDDVAEFARGGVTVLSRRNIEAYLFDDEVLRALCVERALPEVADDLLTDKARVLAASRDRGNASDDLKPAANEICLAARRRLGLRGVGNDDRAFARNVLARTLKPGMATYDELRSVIFGFGTEKQTTGQIV